MGGDRRLPGGAWARVWCLALAAAMHAAPSSASGPERYEATFIERWGGWWCPPWRDHSISEQRLRHPRFSHYSAREIAAIRKVNDARQTSATTSFGPHVIRYAKGNLDDPRVPRALHRLVFATRHACRTAPGEVSRAAHTLLHRHFPDSEWAEKTPHWFDGRL